MAARVLVVDDSPTIRKVVAQILATHNLEPLLAEDGQDALELLARESCDLVLLDFVMPRMNGLQFCRALRASPEHHDLPVVLMSAKGDKIRGHFLHQAGAIDAITKPFDARGLLAVVEGALARKRDARTSVRPSVPDVRATLPPEQGELPTAVGVNPFAEGLAALLVPGLAHLADPKALRTALIGMAEGPLRRALSELLGATPDANPSHGLAADLEVLSIAELLQLIQMQRRTGIVHVESRSRRLTVYVTSGDIALATAQGLREEFLLGRYLVEDGAVERDSIDQVLGEERGGQPLGERLLRRALVTPEQLRAALARQTAELVFECVRWQTGRFRFVVEPLPPPVADLGLMLAVGPLIMEGFRRVDEWRLIEGSFDFDDVVIRDPIAIARLGDPSQLTRLEAAVLERIDGERSVREIVAEIDGSSFELCKAIYQFLNARLVRRAER